MDKVWYQRTIEIKFKYLVLHRWYHRSTVPGGSNVTTFRVDYDLRVLYFDEFEVKDDLPGVLMWIGMKWVDRNIDMCDCSGMNR